MFKKFIQFIKYNNATLVILLVFFVVGTSVFASETGREAFGQKSTRIEGVDNTALIEADLDKMDMDFTIEDISENDKYFFVKYTFLDLDKVDNTWEYQLKEKTRKVSKKSKVNLDKYLVEELKEEYQARIKYLKKQQEKAQLNGVEKKAEISEYSGLVGKTLSLAENVFDGYSAVKVRELPTPINSISLKKLKVSGEEGIEDSLTKVYDDYINKNDRDKDDILNADDNCPDDYNPNQGDRDEDGQGDVCDLNPDEADEILDQVLKDSGDEEGDIIATPTPDTVPDTDTASPTPEIISDTETASPTPETINNSSAQDTSEDSAQEEVESSVDSGDTENTQDNSEGGVPGDNGDDVSNEEQATVVVETPPETDSGDVEIVEPEE